MRIGVIACEIFRRELELLIKDDEDIVYKEYLEFGLHEYPEELKRTVIEKVNSLQGKVDAVFLGYGTCQSLKDVGSQFNVPTVMIEADDCVGALLTQKEYNRERKVCAGTWYAIPAVCEMDETWHRNHMVNQMGEKKVKQLEADGYDTDWFLRTMFNGYSRALFIDTGIGDRVYFEGLSRKFASKLNLRHECRMGTLEVLRTDIAATKRLAQQT